MCNMSHLCFTENFHTQGFYDISIEVMLKFPPIIELLGRPLTASKVDLGDTTKNWTDGLNAQVRHKCDLREKLYRLIIHDPIVFLLHMIHADQLGSPIAVYK